MPKICVPTARTCLAKLFSSSPPNLVAGTALPPGAILLTQMRYVLQVAKLQIGRIPEVPSEL